MKKVWIALLILLLIAVSLVGHYLIKDYIPMDWWKEAWLGF